MRQKRKYKMAWINPESVLIAVLLLAIWSTILTPTVLVSAVLVLAAVFLAAYYLDRRRLAYFKKHQASEPCPLCGSLLLTEEEEGRGHFRCSSCNIKIKQKEEVPKR